MRRELHLREEGLKEAKPNPVLDRKEEITRSPDHQNAFSSLLILHVLRFFLYNNNHHCHYIIWLFWTGLYTSLVVSSSKYFEKLSVSCWLLGYVGHDNVHTGVEPGSFISKETLLSYCSMNVTWKGR